MVDFPHSGKFNEFFELEFLYLPPKSVFEGKRRIFPVSTKKKETKKVKFLQKGQRHQQWEKKGELPSYLP